MGQFDSSAVLGTVRDKAEGVIPGASVTLRNVDTGITSTATTDEGGNYQFPTVRIGTFELTASQKGFKSSRADRVTVVVNARQRVDFLLEPSSVETTVEVTAAAATLVESDTSDRGQVINRRQIVDLPLNGRNYADLALLTAGTRRSNFGGTPREGAFNVNGLRSAVNNFLLDGIDNNAYGTSNQGFSNQVVQVSPDAVSEFKVQTNNMSAEFGRSAGAVVNASLKSGTNELHGTAYEFLRNTDLNAVGYFKPRGNRKPTLVRNQFGFTVGGPVLIPRLYNGKNKTFFFADYEGFRDIGTSVKVASIPTLDQRAGNFGTPIRNPITGALYANGIVPQSDITPFARRVLADLPTPTIAGASNNIQTTPRDKNFNDKADVKLDHQFSQKLTSFVRLSQRKVNILNEPTIPGPDGGDSNGFTRVLNQSLATGATYTLSPTSLIEFRLGISRTRAGKEPTALGGASMLAIYGITGLPQTSNLTGGLSPFDIGGYSRIGRQATNPQWQHPSVVNPKVNFTKIMGRHTIKSGYEYQRVNTEVQDVNPLYGLDGYAGAFSKPAGGTASNTVYNTADFLFGARSSYSLANFLVAQYRQRMHFMYVQDDFKMTPKLTLNLGMRYEYASPQWEENNQLSNYDPATNSIIKAKAGSIFDRALVNPDKNNFAPRLGMAYALSSKTALRSGYGISYVHFNRVGGGNILAINGPQVVIGAVGQDPSRPGFVPTQQGYPSGFTDSKNFDPLKSIVKYLPADMRTSYVQNWHFTVQHELMNGFVIDLGYIGNHGLKYLNFIDFNQARPNNPGETLGVQARRSNQAFATISAGLPLGFSTYHALQFKVEKRMQRGLYLLNSFTWSKAIDNSALALESEDTGQASNPQDARNMKAEKGLSGYNQPFTNVTSVVWELPVGRGRRWGSGMHPAADALIGGWQLTGINAAWTGQPVNLRFASPSPAFQVTDNIGTRWLGGTTQRPNIIGDPYTPEGQRTTSTFFNAATVVLPTDPSRPFGNAGRNIVHGDNVYQLDLGIYKDFRIMERTRLQFRSEMFNILNKTNFFPADGNRSATSFGSIATTFPARQIQFALKLYW